MLEKQVYCAPQLYQIELAQAESLLADSYNDTSNLENPIFQGNWDM